MEFLVFGIMLVWCNL